MVLDVGPRGGALYCEIFVANNLPADQLLITEGTLLTIKREDFAAVEARFSPTARFAVNAFLNDPQSVLSRLLP